MGGGGVVAAARAVWAQKHLVSLGSVLSSEKGAAGSAGLRNGPDSSPSTARPVVSWSIRRNRGQGEAVLCSCLPSGQPDPHKQQSGAGGLPGEAVGQRHSMWDSTKDPCWSHGQAELVQVAQSRCFSPPTEGGV